MRLHMIFNATKPTYITKICTINNKNRQSFLLWKSIHLIQSILGCILSIPIGCLIMLSIPCLNRIKTTEFGKQIIINIIRYGIVNASIFMCFQSSLATWDKLRPTRLWDDPAQSLLVRRRWEEKHVWVWSPIFHLIERLRYAEICSI